MSSTDPSHVYALLQKACRELDDRGDHAIAALVGQSMVMLAEKYGLPHHDDGDDD